MLTWLWTSVKRFLFDPSYAIPRIRTLLLALAASTYLNADTIGELFASDVAKRWAKRVAVLLAILAPIFKGGDKNEDADAIAAKLRAAGHLPPPPPPDSAGFASVRSLFVIAFAAALGIILVTGCSGDTVRAVIGIRPAHASVSPSAVVQFEAVGAGAPTSWSVVEAGGGAVSSSGLYQAPACPTVGTFHVQVTAGGKTATATATVEDGVASVSVSPSTFSIASGGTQQLTATVTSKCGVVSSASAAVVR